MFLIIIIEKNQNSTNQNQILVEEQESDAQRVLMAIAAHKLFDGFALGLAVVS